jgi:hypothetical protein
MPLERQLGLILSLKRRFPPESMPFFGQLAAE